MATQTTQPMYKGSITLARVKDGQNASNYYIESNSEEILRFVDGEGTVTYSPSELTFKVYDLTADKTLSLDGNFSLAKLEEESNEWIGLLESTKSITVSEDKTTVTVTVSTLMEELDVDEEDLILPLLKFVYCPNKKAVSTKIITTRHGLTNDMAQLQINAADIVAKIKETSWRFSENGVELANGDLKIKKTTYTKIEIADEDDFNSNKEDLYILDNNYTYIKASEWVSGKDYYTRSVSDDLAFYADKDGNLALSGNVYAEDGVFKGRVEATEGEFTGKIIATEGQIGGFDITTDNKLISYDGKSIVLNGGKGEIIAENIQLGGGAEITDSIVFSGEYIKFSGTTFKDGEKYYILEDGKYELTADEAPVEGETYYYFSGARLSNPNKHKGEILRSNGVSIYNDGRINLGTLELYGGSGNLDGYMRSNFIDANGQKNDGYWRINENGTASFTNIIADEAVIKNSVLEINTIQNIGSQMIFKPSWRFQPFPSLKGGYLLRGNYAEISNHNGEWMWDGTNYRQIVDIKEIKYYQKDKQSGEYTEWANEIDDTNQYFRDKYDFIVPDNFNDGEKRYENYQNDEYMISTDTKYSEEKTYYALRSVGTIQATEDYRMVLVVLSGSLEKKQGVISLFGETRNTNPNNFILSINGQEGSNSSVKNFDVPMSLTMSSFDMGENNQVSYTKHLILGKLNSSGIDLLQNAGMGLYADNVYLNGSLVTRINSDNNISYYAGIGTNSKISFAQDSKKDISPIVFWAGAEVTEAVGVEDAVNSAPFQVTQNGTLYASKAIIKNSLMVGTNLYASNIYGTNIRGWKDDGKDGTKAALNIYDTSEGINFKEEQVKLDKGYKSSSEINQDNFKEWREKGIYIKQGEEYIKIEDDDIFDETKVYYIYYEESETISTTTFTINQEGFLRDNSSFIKIPKKEQNLPVEFIGKFMTLGGSEPSIQMDSNKISFWFDKKEFGGVALINDESNSDRKELKINFDDTDPIISMYQEKIETNKDAIFNSSLWFGSKMEIRKTTNDSNYGYDLYVY